MIAEDLRDHPYVVKQKQNPTPQEIFFKVILGRVSSKAWPKINVEESFQVPFRHPFGFYIADFYIDCMRLVFEIDGGVHWLNNRLSYDIKRKNYFDKIGIKVISIPNVDIDNIPKIKEGARLFRGRISKILMDRWLEIGNKHYRPLTKAQRRYKNYHSFADTSGKTNTCFSSAGNNYISS